MGRKANITEEDFLYTKEMLETIIIDILKVSNESNMRMFEKHQHAILHYSDSISEVITKTLDNNNVCLDSNVKITGSKSSKYFRGILRVVMSRLSSRLDEKDNYNVNELENFMSYINSYIHIIASDYDIQLS